MNAEEIIAFKFSDKNVQSRWANDAPGFVEAVNSFEKCVQEPLEDNVPVLRKTLVSWAHHTGRLAFILPRLNSYYEIAERQLQNETAKWVKVKGKERNAEAYVIDGLRPIAELVATIQLASKEIDKSKAMLKTVLNLEMQSKNQFD